MEIFAELAVITVYRFFSHYVFSANENLEQYISLVNQIVTISKSKWKMIHYFYLWSNWGKNIS